MARIFSIDFSFRQKHYTALVTAGSALNGNARYVVAPNDEYLQQLLPEGKVCFNNLSDLEPMAEVQPRLHDLLLSMAPALHQKLNPAASG